MHLVLFVVVYVFNNLFLWFVFWNDPNLSLRSLRVCVLSVCVFDCILYECWESSGHTALLLHFIWRVISVRGQASIPRLNQASVKSRTVQTRSVLCFCVLCFSAHLHISICLCSFANYSHECNIQLMTLIIFLQAMQILILLSAVRVAMRVIRNETENRTCYHSLPRWIWFTCPWSMTQKMLCCEFVSSETAGV